MALGGVPIPRAFLVLTAALALGFAVNARPTRRPRRPALQRLAWTAAAAVSLAAIPNDAPVGAGGGGVAISLGGLIVAAAVAVLLVAAIVRTVQGVFADRGDRLLIGVLAGLVGFGALAVTSLPPIDAGWLYPFGALLGAAVARANGNIRRP
jgi:hypothetical protein